jgi:hypothetical protein
LVILKGIDRDRVKAAAVYALKENDPRGRINK